MRNLSEESLTDAVLAKLQASDDSRFETIMTSLIRHLHAFVREVELTEAEWLEGIKFLTATGQKCDDKRQEFILLSDVLGVSMLVDAINHRSPKGVTASTILGPFYVEGGGKPMENGADIAAGVPGGEPALIRGRVTTPDGRPIEGATVDVWHVRPDQLYDVQDPDSGLQLRGKFRTDVEGRYWFRTVKPVSYPVPTDGPVGLVLDRMGRHPMRPAHVHFIVSAPGYAPVVTHIFAEGDPYLDSDAVFGVKNSLVGDFKRIESADEARRLGIGAPGYVCEFDFGLAPVGARKAA